MSLLDILRAQQPMPFVDYMQQALYAPQFGYYSAGLPKIGKDGDFITAPELNPLFAYTLANQCREVLEAMGGGCLFEFGAGTGALCLDLLTRLDALDSLPERYYILELSPALRHRQKTKIEDAQPELAQRVVWLDQWPEKPLQAVVLANEVLDAMPVHRFMKTEEAVLESYIYVDEDLKLSEQFQPSQNERLIHYVHEQLADLPVPYVSEVNLFVEGWLKEIHAMLAQGAVFLIDYGFPRHEYYHPDRHLGTLMCHYQHRAHPDVLAHPGEQDITAHVDFTQVAEAGFDAGFHVAGYCNQASFLLANGLLSLVAEVEDERERLAVNQAVKQWIQPEEMGELFKVIALTKGLDISLTGFGLMDRRVNL